MQVGTTKDQSLYNKPSAAVHPGALTAGTLPQYNTRHAPSWLIVKFAPPHNYLSEMTGESNEKPDRITDLRGEARTRARHL